MQSTPSPNQPSSTPRRGYPIRGRHRGQNRRRTAQAYPAIGRRGQTDHLQADRQDAHQQKIQRLLSEKRGSNVSKKPQETGAFCFTLILL